MLSLQPSHSTNQESGADTLRMEELIGLLQSLYTKFQIWIVIMEY